MQATRTLRQTQEPRLENYPFLTVVLQLSNADSLSHAAPRMVKNLKRFEKAGFRSHNFLAQLLSETSTACTIRVRRSSLGRLWNDLGSHAGLHHRNIGLSKRLMQGITHLRSVLERTSFRRKCGV